MDPKQLEGKKVFWSSRWDKLWLLPIPAFFLIDIFISDRYSPLWFWIILCGASIFIIYVGYHLFHPRFKWVDPSTREGKQIQALAFEKRYEDMGLFEYLDNGFNYLAENQSLFVQWTDIESIFAYKQDLMVVDELNMDIFLSNKTRIHLTEESPGWYQFIEKIKKVFPEIDPEFEARVIFPAFATNLTLVYQSTGETATELINRYYES